MSNRLPTPNEGDKYISYLVQPNFKRLGPRVGRLMPAVKKALANADGAELLSQLEAQGKVVLRAGRRVGGTGRRGYRGAVAGQRRLDRRPRARIVVVVLATELTPELIREGYAQDLKRFVQDRRKALDCEYTDRIQVGIDTESDEVWTAVQENLEFLRTRLWPSRSAAVHCVVSSRSIAKWRARWSRSM